MTKKRKPVTKWLVGGQGRPPSFDEIMALFRKLTGREPTPQELAEAKATRETHLEAQRLDSRRRAH